MALLESGRVYDIPMFNYAKDFHEEKFLENFIKNYKEKTGIEDPKYSTYQTIEETANDTEVINYYLYLPYINPPLKTQKGNLFLSLLCYQYKKEKNEIQFAGPLTFDGIKEKDNEKELTCSFGGNISINSIYSGYNFVNGDYYRQNAYYTNKFFVCYDPIEPWADDTVGVWMHIDTRFLDTHGFYTISCASSYVDNDLDSTFPLDEPIYFSPTIFVCDMIDQITGKHYDSIFAIDIATKGQPDDMYGHSYSAIGIGFDDNNIEYYENNSFIPQLYERNDNSIVLQKLQFGRLKTDNIYVTNMYNNDILAEKLSIFKVEEYKDVWLKNILYKNDKNFLVGLTWAKEQYHWSDIDLYNYNTGYVPVIEDKGLIPLPDYIVPEIEIPEPIALKFSSDENFTLNCYEHYWNGTIEYSINKGKNWNIWDGSKLSGTKDKAIYLRGTNNTKIAGNSWHFTGKYCNGNIELLLDYQTVINKEHPPMEEQCYMNMFANCTSLIQAPELPAIELANSCYSNMFFGCASLIQPPELPATILAEECYESMFSRCTSLIQAPKIAATRLANRCCFAMFYGCTSLTQPSELPATTLDVSCYYIMFRDCTSLIQAPKLPAITLTQSCYSGMFENCTSLKQAPELPATELAYSCYADMFSSCTSLEQAPELPAITLAPNCYMNMFSFCTSLTQAPELPATTLALADSCYQSMFYGCTSLKQAPTLPATTLAVTCYRGMFYGCTSLKQAPTLPATTLTYSCYREMFYGCTSLKQAPTLPATTLEIYCYADMFRKCTLLEQASELPATTLADCCYQGMFYGCTSLTQAPSELPANIMSYSCYDTMFSDCISLMQAPKILATTVNDNCCRYMFSGCTSLIRIPNLYATILSGDCYYYMFNSCSSLKISTSSTEYNYGYRIPTSGQGRKVGYQNPARGMFANTGGSFKGAPSLNTTYYVEYEPI